MQKLITRLNDLFSVISGWLMLVMMCVLLIDVIWRVFFGSLPNMADISVFVMMVVVYLGLSRCEEYDEHVRLEFLTDASKGRVRSTMIICARLCALLAVAALVYSVTVDAWESYLINEVVPGELNLPVWPTKFIMVVGAVLFLVQTFLHVFRPLKGAPKAPSEDLSALL